MVEVSITSMAAVGRTMIGGKAAEATSRTNGRRIIGDGYCVARRRIRERVGMEIRRTINEN